MCESKFKSKTAMTAFNILILNKLDQHLKSLTGQQCTEVMNQLLKVDRDAWREEVGSQEEFFAQFGDRIPSELAEEQRKMRQRLA